MSRHHRRRSRDLRASDVVERAIDLALNHAGGVVFTLRVSHEDDRGHRARVESCRTRTPTVTFSAFVGVGASPGAGRARADSTVRGTAGARAM